MKKNGDCLAHILDHAGRRSGNTLRSSNKRLRFDAAETQALYHKLEWR
jgi:hypothetical protein